MIFGFAWTVVEEVVIIFFIVVPFFQGNLIYPNIPIISIPSILVHATLLSLLVPNTPVALSYEIPSF